ncbi:MAG: type IV pilus assembly protein PilM [Patescibacteria group bacterium]
MSFFTTKEIAFGLDISDHCLRLVQLHKRGKKIRLQLYNEISLPSGCLEGGEIKQSKPFLEALVKLIKTRHGHGKLSDEVIAVLPESKTFLKVIDIPLVEKEKINDEIKLVLPQHVPLNIEEVYFDWQIIKTEAEKQTLIVGISPQNIIDSYVAILTQAGLIPTALEIEAAAIARAIVPDQDQEPKVVIDIGANRTGLFLIEEGFVKFTISLPISGNRLTQLIAEALELDREQAEQAKIVCGLDKNKCHGALLEILSDTIDELCRNILEATNFYRDNFKNAKELKQIMLCGGGACFSEMAANIQNKIKLAAVVANPWQNIINPQNNYFSSGKSQSFITALGLARRGLSPETFL